MGKLGKKARKFAKKNLQSVLRQKRKTKALFKKRYSSKNGRNIVEKHVENMTEATDGRNVDGEDAVSVSLDAIFTEDDNDVISDASDSDGFLSEDSSCPYFVESENEENGHFSTLISGNKKILEDLTMQKKKLDKFKKKDPEFVMFLESYNKREMPSDDEMLSDEDEANNHEMQLDDDKYSATTKGKLLTSSVVNSWGRLITEDRNESALVNLINAYRAACHLGSEPRGLADASCPIIRNSDTFCNIYTFVLREADSIFRSLLKLPSPTCNKERILELKNTARWKKLRPIVKSYLRSTLFLLKHVTDSKILAFSLARLRVSVVFFAAFPSLLSKLIKIIIPLWATGGGTLSSCSFLILYDVASIFSSNYFDTCLIKTYKAYIARCRNLEIVDARHIEFLRNSFVDICSLDVQRTSVKALVSIRQLANILRQALQKDKKEAVKNICSWQYTKCIDIWVVFISANAGEHDIQSLLYLTIRLINGVASLFSGPRYLPLRKKCVEWLNELSSSSGIFIPVASLVLDILEYKIVKEGGKPKKSVDCVSNLKLPKYWLKSQNFQEECVHSAVELLSAHFLQWSYHISFPELATTPLIRLRKFHESTTVESLRRVVKRLIDQVEHNVEFVQKKRGEVTFSPNDRDSVDLFLQLEKANPNTPFIQYYKSVREKATARNLHKTGKKSIPKQKGLKKKSRQLRKRTADGDLSNGNIDSEGKQRRAIKV